MEKDQVFVTFYAVCVILAGAGLVSTDDSTLNDKDTWDTPGLSSNAEPAVMSSMDEGIMSDDGITLFDESSDVPDGLSEKEWGSISSQIQEARYYPTWLTILAILFLLVMVSSSAEHMGIMLAKTMTRVLHTYFIFTMILLDRRHLFLSCQH